MGKNQKCRNCKNRFADDAPEKNYALYANYGFENEEQFQTHNAKNKNCPGKMFAISVTVSPEYDENTDSSSMDESPPTTPKDILEVEWGPYNETISISPEDYADNQEISQIKLKKHNRGGNPLWFENTIDASYIILEQLLNPVTQFITVVGEPGSGKTSLMLCLLYAISMLSYEKAIHPNCITLTTGMSDTSWFDQVIETFKVRDGSFLVESLYAMKDNHCVSHLTNFHKRITWQLNHPEYISNSIYIIDEPNFADDIEMTIDNEFKRLGLTEEKMIAYNIKIITVSSTPDVSLLIMSRQDNHKMVILKNGSNYKGFEYYTNHNMIIDYTPDIDLEIEIRKKYSTPRYHFIRARKQPENTAYREKLISIANKNEWIVIEDDSEHNYYLSFIPDENEILQEIHGKAVIRTYLQPLKHTVILIKNKYPSRKRLKITRFTGIVIEPPEEKINTTTSNGLITRFWGYEEMPQFPHNQKPFFVCDKKNIDEYFNFKEDFVYNGKSYTSNVIESDETKLKELKTTWFRNLANTFQLHIKRLLVLPL